MSRPSEPLHAELSEVLGQLEAAVAARFAGSRGKAHRRRETPPAQATRLRGAVGTALRWLGQSRPEPPPTQS